MSEQRQGPGPICRMLGAGRRAQAAGRWRTRRAVPLLLVAAASPLLGTMLLAAPLLRARTPVAAETTPPAGTPLELVRTMARNEHTARLDHHRFRYTSDERSTRTGGHIWEERVAETEDGPIRRLVAVDGKALTPAQTAAESRRIEELVAHPEALLASNAERRADEARISRLLDILPDAFLLAPDGAQDGCDRIAYQPNPQFVPSSYEERIVHGMAGSILIDRAAMRLCGISGHLVERISFGYGLLGHVDKGSRFSVTRTPVNAVDWKTSHVSVHMDGKVLMLKSISRDTESVHKEERLLPPNLTLAEAAAMTQP